MKPDHYIVCTFNEDLIRRFSHKAIVALTTDSGIIPHIKRVVDESNKLHCIQLNYQGKLASLPIQEDWKGIPLHVYVNGLGVFRDFIPKIGLLRQLSVRVFMSSEHPQNFTDLQILSSLGIETGLYFGNYPINWNLVNDLSYYAVYGKVNHASIEPFNYILKEYSPEIRTDFSSVYFDNPDKYVHINSEFKIALSAKDIQKGNFILESPEKLSELREMKEYKDYMRNWQTFFLKTEGCAFCPAWRVCLGKFEAGLKDNPGCTQVFHELMNAADFNIQRKKGDFVKELCQP